VVYLLLLLHPELKSISVDSDPIPPASHSHSVVAAWACDTLHRFETIERQIEKRNKERKQYER